MRRWKTYRPDKDRIDLFASGLGISRHVAGVLCANGISGIEEAKSFLNPRLDSLQDPFVLPDMESAVRRIWQAIEGGERIAVYGDYDVDGITSTALFMKTVQALGGNVIPWLPHRLEEGYGLTRGALTRCMDGEHPGLVVTVDCGTNSTDAAGMLAEKGIDLIVTDHHESSGDLVDACAVVNPKVGDREDMRILAGVGVVFKLCHALLKFGRDNNRRIAHEIDLREYLDFVALGTIADIVSLRGENRVLVRHGLERLNRTACVGLSKLAEVSGVKRRIETYHVGFILGPRLNAAGRMGNAELALRLLMCEDKTSARNIAMKLDDSNRSRKKTESEIYEQAVKQIDAYFDPEKHFGLVVSGRNWHSGVIGVVAARIVARYRRPVAVVAVDADGSGRGSCRSIEGYNILAGLGHCSDLLSSFGGHEMAAGLDVSESAINEFGKLFNEAVASSIKGKDLRPVLDIAGWLGLGEAGSILLDEIAALRPFGQDNAVPVWAVKGVSCESLPRKVGRNHLKLCLTDGRVKCNAIAFGMADRPMPEGLMDVAFTLQSDDYAGPGCVQLNVKDFRPSREHDAT